MAKSAKFIWIAAVESERRFTPAQRLILSRAARVNVGPGEFTFCVQQATLAERCSVGIATVKRAIARARELQYLALIAERQRGRGHHRADTYGLRIPEIGINETPIPEGIGINLDVNRDQPVPEIGINEYSENTPPPAETPALMVSKEGLTLVPNGTSEGSAPAQTTRGHRLRPGWHPHANVIAAMADELRCDGQALKREHRKFTDYWLAKPGQGGIKLDWNATWRNWMRRAHERGELRHQPNGRPLATSDQRVHDILDMKTPTPRRELH